MGDILSAASLLLAILTALYGFYYPSIKEVIDSKVDTEPKNNREKYDKSKIVWKTKLLPLLLTSVALTVIFIPEFLEIIKSSISVIFGKQISSKKYDTVKASYLAVTIFIIVLTGNIIVASIKLQKKIKKLKPT